MKGNIQSTDNTIATAEMGKILIEHVLVGMPEWNLDLKAPKFILAEAMARAVDRLQELHDYGCKTIIDPRPMDLV